VPPAFVAVKEGVKTPNSVGIPLRMPVVAFRVIPEGRLPEAIA
jgi:hypothetical protein